MCSVPMLKCVNGSSRLRSSSASEQLEVAARACRAPRCALEVAVVADAEVGDLEALRQVRRHRARICSWMRPVEAVRAGGCARGAGEVGGGLADLVLAGEVRLDELEALAPGCARQLAQPLGVARPRAARRRRARGSSRRWRRRAVRCGRRRTSRSTGSATTVAPNDSAISTVRSVEPVSTTIDLVDARRHGGEAVAGASPPRPSRSCRARCGPRRRGATWAPAATPRIAASTAGARAPGGSDAWRSGGGTARGRRRGCPAGSRGSGRGAPRPRRTLSASAASLRP